MTTKLEQPRLLCDIAREIRGDWSPINNLAAEKALEYMETIGSVDQGRHDGYSAIGAFLTHAIGWRGPAARRIKKELRVMSGHPRP